MPTGPLHVHARARRGPVASVFRRLKKPEPGGEIGGSHHLFRPVRLVQLLNILQSALVKNGIAARQAEVLSGRTPVVPVFARILVVEDNQVNQKMTVKLLEKLGLGVDLAANGKEAVEMLERSSYDLVFMDCQMPEMDGYQPFCGTK